VLSLDEGRTQPTYGYSSTSAPLASDAGGVLPVPHVLGIVGFVPKHVVAGAPIRSRHYVLAPERETVRIEWPESSIPTPFSGLESIPFLSRIAFIPSPKLAF
jgi:hypothetical protein